MKFVTNIKPIKMKKVITTFEIVPAIGFMAGYDKCSGLIIVIPFLSIAIKIQKKPHVKLI